MHPRTRFALIGADGLVTLLLATLLIPLTLGITLLLAARRVVTTARVTPSLPAETGIPVVLGVRLQQGAIGRDYRLRLERAFSLWQRQGGDVIILGGVTDGGPLSEAAVGRDYLRQRGLPVGAITIEEASRHTLENLQNARPLLQRLSGRPLLITNRYHLARVVAMADGIGIAHLPCAAETDFLWSLPQLLRLLSESFFLHWYRVGRGWSRLTRNHHSLSRIS